jgi:hypothetical protein
MTVPSGARPSRVAELGESFKGSMARKRKRKSRKMYLNSRFATDSFPSSSGRSPAPV